MIPRAVVAEVTRHDITFLYQERTSSSVVPSVRLSYYDDESVVSLLLKRWHSAGNLRCELKRELKLTHFNFRTLPVGQQVQVIARMPAKEAFYITHPN